MNKITDDLWEYGMQLADEGYSIREMAKILHIAKETASRIQKNAKLMMFMMTGHYNVLTGGGRKDCRRLHYIQQQELKPSLFRQHYVPNLQSFLELKKEIEE